MAKFHPEAEAEAAGWMMINTICGAVTERANLLSRPHFCFAKLEDDYTGQLVHIIFIKTLPTQHYSLPKRRGQVGDDVDRCKCTIILFR